MIDRNTHGFTGSGRAMTTRAAPPEPGEETLAWARTDRQPRRCPAPARHCNAPLLSGKQWV